MYASSYALLSSSYALLQGDTSRNETLGDLDAEEAFESSMEQTGASIEMSQVLLSLLTPVLNDGLTPITGGV